MLGQQLEQLLEILDLETLERDWFRGVSPQNGRDRIFGGQVMAQALVAAYRTVEGRIAHSFHSYFIRPGDPRTPILYQVDRIRDGQSYTTRRVVAIQHGEAIFHFEASFCVAEEGLSHQVPAEVPAEPEGRLYEDEIRAELARHAPAIQRDDRRFDLPIELRAIGGLHLFDRTVRAPRTRTWLRAKGALPDGEGLHQAVLAYASDFTLLVSAVLPHPIGMAAPGFRSASLDHAMWFHRPFRADDWLLFDQDSPITDRARGFARGAFYTRDGRLVASCAQEGMMRYRPPM
ncbi:MAG TPA: acyl-CoA thioesterase II [Myxococcota bacterium]|nr:acyl-CoA thioesterase II [Myxococcota bacterium]